MLDWRAVRPLASGTGWGQPARLAPAHGISYIARAMIRRLTTLLALLWFGSVESAQAQHRTYPSLSRRAVESRDRDAELIRSLAEQQQTPPKAVDPTILAELRRLETQADAGGTAFDKDLAGSDRAVGAAGSAAVASEAWVVAQQSVSALDASRFDSVSALAGLDSIYVEQLNGGGDVATVDGYRAPVLAMVDRQNDRLDMLRSRLAKP